MAKSFVTNVSLWCLFEDEAVVGPSWATKFTLKRSSVANIYFGFSFIMSQDFYQIMGRVAVITSV